MKKILIFISLLTLIFSCKKESKSLSKIRGKQIEINQTLDSDSSYINEIAPYKIKLQNKINKILCYNPRTLNRIDGELESSLGNIFADICFKKADSIFYNKTKKHIDFALFNYDGIRTLIPKGNITVKNIFELMPFENVLVVAQLSGKQINSLINYLETNTVAHPISNMQLKMNNDKIVDISINMQKYDKSKSYYVLTHDYLQHGGDNMTFFKNPISLFNTQLKVRDALIGYMQNVDTLHAKLDGRFIKINKP